MTDPGWKEDPERKHEWRYHDGSDWTEWVTDGGATSSAPLDDGSGEAAREAGKARRERSGSEHHRLHPAMVAILAIVVLAGAGYGLYRYGSNSDATRTSQPVNTRPSITTKPPVTQTSRAAIATIVNYANLKTADFPVSQSWKACSSCGSPSSDASGAGIRMNGLGQAILACSSIARTSLLASPLREAISGPLPLTGFPQEVLRFSLVYTPQPAGTPSQGEVDRAFSAAGAVPRSDMEAVRQAITIMGKAAFGRCVLKAVRMLAASRAGSHLQFSTPPVMTPIRTAAGVVGENIQLAGTVTGAASPETVYVDWAWMHDNLAIASMAAYTFALPSCAPGPLCSDAAARDIHAGLLAHMEARLPQVLVALVKHQIGSATNTRSAKKAKLRLPSATSTSTT